MRRREFVVGLAASVPLLGERWSALRRKRRSIELDIWRNRQ